MAISKKPLPNQLGLFLCCPVYPKNKRLLTSDLYNANTNTLIPRMDQQLPYPLRLTIASPIIIDSLTPHLYTDEVSEQHIGIKTLCGEADKNIHSEPSRFYAVDENTLRSSDATILISIEKKCGACQAVYQARFDA
jgi:hypothetical protein